MRRQRALSALLSSILLTQQLVCSFARPAEQLSSTQEVSFVQETVQSETAGTTTEPTPKPPSEPKRWWQKYPQGQSLYRQLGMDGYISEWMWSTSLPMSMWNTTAENITEECLKYLEQREARASRDTGAGCVAKYYCDVARDYRRFPAVLIRAECKSDQECNNAEHIGIGIVPNSIGNCLPYNQVDVTVLTFQPDQEAGTDSATTNESAAEVKGKWVANYNVEYRYIPINCRCRAK